MDTAKPGVIEFRKTEEKTSVKVERANTQVRDCLYVLSIPLITSVGQNNDEVHLFFGQENPAKDVDCVLIYDEDSKVRALK